MKNLYFDPLPKELCFSSLMTQRYCAFSAEGKQLKVNSIISKAEKKYETLAVTEF
jgi:hypothetical protein